MHRSLRLLHLVGLLLASAAPQGKLQGDALQPPPSLLSNSVRAALLQEIDNSFEKSASRSEARQQADWYSAGAEKLLDRLLSRLPGLPTDEMPSGRARDVSPAAIDGSALEALWLLCRTQMGCIEAVLKELDKGVRAISSERAKWQSIHHSSWSWTFVEGIGMTGALLEHKARSLIGRTNGRPKPLLGRARTRLGMGARRRALLCCERALMTFAGQLHDMRVGLRAAGGEWLELGRWLGGPAMESMEWEVGLSPERRLRLLQLCVRAGQLVGDVSSAMQRLGPYELYREPVPPVPSGLSSGTELTASLRLPALASGEEPSQASHYLTLALIDGVRTQVAELRALRRAIRVPAPASLKAPG
jgi:hypothetical protein